MNFSTSTFRMRVFAKEETSCYNHRVKRKYYITGIAGTGKSTLASELRKHNILTYDVDVIEGLCHWRHKETKEKARYFTGVGKDWIDAHEWICDEEMLRSMLDKHPDSDVIVVGIASNQENFLKLFNNVFLLYCSEETFIHRLNTRSEGNNFAKDKSEQEQILSWYKDFQEKMIQLGAIPINTDKPLEEVVAEIRNKMREQK